MASFARVAAEVNESTSPAFLVAFQQHAASQAYFQPLAEHVEVKLKEVRYSRLQKMQTLVALGTSSGRCTRVGAWRASLTRGQINAFLARMTADKLSPLELAHQRLLRDHSRLRTASTVVVDVDETGLCVTGKTSELAAKGYFPRRRGARGYQNSVALAGSEGKDLEILAGYIDPGNTNGTFRLPDLLRTTFAVLEQRGSAIRIA